jgi:HPr kinase/phosphorylase
MMTMHASAAARDGAGVLLLGPPGSGKSDLLLRLLDIGFVLVADDQVCLDGRVASAPASMAGLVEVRGLGIVRFAHVTATLRLAVRLGPGPRLPEPERLRDLDLPVINIDPRAASAPLRVALALDCVVGHRTLVTGAFTGSDNAG